MPGENVFARSGDGSEVDPGDLGAEQSDRNLFDGSSGREAPTQIRESAYVQDARPWPPVQNGAELTDTNLFETVPPAHSFESELGATGGSPSSIEQPRESEEPDGSSSDVELASWTPPPGRKAARPRLRGLPGSRRLALGAGLAVIAASLGVTLASVGGGTTGQSRATPKRTGRYHVDQPGAARGAIAAPSITIPSTDQRQVRTTPTRSPAARKPAHGRPGSRHHRRHARRDFHPRRTSRPAPPAQVAAPPAAPVSIPSSAGLGSFGGSASSSSQEFNFER
jgi:hypothetical protein